MYVADSHMTRKTPAAYSDGVYMMSGQDRPSPRKLSSLFMKGSDGLASSKNRTAMLAFFGKKYSTAMAKRVVYPCYNFGLFFFFRRVRSRRSSGQLRDRDGQRERLSDRSAPDRNRKVRRDVRPRVRRRQIDTVPQGWLRPVHWSESEHAETTGESVYISTCNNYDTRFPGRNFLAHPVIRSLLD